MSRPVPNLDEEARVALFRGKEQDALASLRAAAGTGDRERAQLQLDVWTAVALSAVLPSRSSRSD